MTVSNQLTLSARKTVIQELIEKQHASVLYAAEWQRLRDLLSALQDVLDNERLA